eukprot:CAMPEP_0172641508 /NCGR_PEP_ID=MMETSP1068-20121228/227639_1 /TAXON_ID=35684 /ORGANISM="Pseudopedinella elastica, Strain CCMP716" /LENGTH=88 /DNA_ID=CAMNT_0013455109 /DNA_START=151 /DNA_END=414 /DNA_ORIENTATION=-
MASDRGGRGQGPAGAPGRTLLRVSPAVRGANDLAPGTATGTATETATGTGIVIEAGTEIVTGGRVSATCSSHSGVGARAAGARKARAA